MPIISPVELHPIEQAEFARLDYQVMRCAHDSQNDLGRLCDEVIYQNDLAARLEAVGFRPIRKEVPLTVTHGDFSKKYFIDLVVGDTAIYELKTTACLVPEHDSQLLNYLLLHGVSHGKLINFRPAQVETKFINTRLTPKARRRLEIHMDKWHETDEGSSTLRKTLLGLLEDWGAFLEIPLYEAALIHFLGGDAKVLREVPLSRDRIPLGSQTCKSAGPETAFQLTALTSAAHVYEKQLRSWLNLTPLRAIHWINMSRHRIEFITLSK